MGKFVLEIGRDTLTPFLILRVPIGSIIPFELREIRALHACGIDCRSNVIFRIILVGALSGQPDEISL